MLVEENGALVVNRQMKSKLLTNKNTDHELMKAIKRETANSQDRSEIEIDEDGTKKFNGLIYIPKTMEKAVIERFHDDLREGHPGITRTMEKIQRSYYFPGMYRKIKRYIKQCESCNRNKNEYAKPLMIDKELPTKPWRRLTADFVEMPETQNLAKTETFDELLVVVLQVNDIDTNAKDSDNGGNISVAMGKSILSVRHTRQYSIRP